MSFHRAVPLTDLPVGVATPALVDGERLALCRVDAHTVRAVEDCCSHDGAAFAGGTLQGDMLECPRHGARFDVATGRALRLPATAALVTFPARVSADGWVEVDL